MTPRFEVIAPSRLHFGLYSFGHTSDRQFGGVGVMVSHPRLRLAVEANERFLAVGPQAERIATFAERWRAFHHRAELPACRLEVLESPREHSGFGTGTQLGLATATALNAWCGISATTALELALSVGRGLRSAVGTYGFHQGGLIVERGKFAHEPLSPLDARLDLPDAWRFVLVTAHANAGISGTQEIQAFAKLPPVPAATTERLIQLVREQLLPATLQVDFESFAPALTKYCREAGLCFAAVQGGAYNGPRLTALIDLMQRLGARGVGQSSWGPCLFALMPTESKARDFVERLAASNEANDCEIQITAASNIGATIQTCEKI